MEGTISFKKVLPVAYILNCFNFSRFLSANISRQRKTILVITKVTLFTD